jgi:hypothetical protein
MNVPDSNQGEPQLADKIANREYHAWRQKVDMLVTCLCMGSQHYVDQLNSGGVATGEYEMRTVEMGGRQIQVRVAIVQDRLAKERKSGLLAQADAARIQIAKQLGTPDLARWSTWAPKAMADPRLIRWLEIQRLIPARTAAGGQGRKNMPETGHGSTHTTKIDYRGTP